MDYFIWSPVLHHVLIRGSHRELSLFLRKIGWFRCFWFYSMAFVSQVVLADLFNSMRVDDLVLLLNIEWFKSRSITNCLNCVIPSVLSLIIGMNTSWIPIANVFIDHLPSPRFSHVMLIVLY